jgi:hypothetical protein
MNDDEYMAHTYGDPWSMPAHEMTKEQRATSVSKLMAGGLIKTPDDFETTNEVFINPPYGDSAWAMAQAINAFHDLSEIAKLYSSPRQEAKVSPGYVTPTTGSMYPSKVYEFPMQKLTRNAVRCHNCGDVVESKHRHDFVACSCFGLSACCHAPTQWVIGENDEHKHVECTKCKAEWPTSLGIAVDGGLEYQRMVGNGSYDDLSEYEETT